MFRAALALALLASPAAASENCAPYDALAKALEQRYGEAPVERGLSMAGEMVEWWANDDTGTWTVLVYSASGTACILAAGELYEAVAVKPKGVDG